MIVSSIFVFALPGRQDVFVESTSLIIICISILNIFDNPKQPYSLCKIFYLFTLFFYGIAPLVQFKESKSMWSGEVLNAFDYLRCNVVLICTMMSYSVVYNISKLRCKRELTLLNTFNSVSIEKSERWSFITVICMVGFSLIILFLTLFINNFSIFNLLLRGGELTESIQEISQIESLIFGKFLRPIPVIIIIFYLLSKKIKWYVLFTMLITALLTLAPTAVARFQAAAVYMPLFLLMFPFVAKGNRFVYAFVFGILFIFPFLNLFRYFGNEDISFTLNTEMFLEGHFDAYYNFAYLLKYPIITYGYQFLGVVFFFVPRALWPTKPIGSGYLLADEYGFSFNNISMTFPAEGYINAGFFGIFIFICILAYISARLDIKFWMTNTTTLASRVRYFVMLGMIFFLMRGDMMNGIAFLCATLASVTIVNKLIKLTSKFKL